MEMQFSLVLIPVLMVNLSIKIVWLQSFFDWGFLFGFTHWYNSSSQATSIPYLHHWLYLVSWGVIT